MGRAIALAFMILAFNVGLTIVGGIEDAYYLATGEFILGRLVSPYAQYSVVQDSYGYNVAFNETDSMINATERATGYQPQTALVDETGFWAATKNLLAFGVNVLFRGFLGLPAFLSEKLSMPTLFAVPLMALLGIIQIIGVYEFIRGKDI